MAARRPADAPAVPAIDVEPGQAEADQAQRLAAGEGLLAGGEALDPRLELIIGHVLRASVYNSPWPSPETLADLNALEPGLHRDLIEEVKKQAEHRRALEKATVENSLSMQARAQRNSFLIASGGLLLAGGLSLLGAPTALSITIVIVAIGGPNAATVLSRMIGRRQDGHPPS